MFRIRKWLNRHTNERGDVVQTIFMLPIAIFLLFALINLSSYFNVRAQVQDVARQGARLTALYGGTNSFLNHSGQDVNSTVLNTLWDGSTGRCKLSYCTTPPQVNCTPSVTTQAGQLVSCTIKYWYSPIAPVPHGLEGLNGVTGQPMTVSSTYVAETGVK